MGQGLQGGRGEHLGAHRQSPAPQSSSAPAPRDVCEAWLAWSYACCHRGEPPNWAVACVSLQTNLNKTTHGFFRCIWVAPAGNCEGDARARGSLSLEVSFCFTATLLSRQSLPEIPRKETMGYCRRPGAWSGDVWLLAFHSLLIVGQPPVVRPCYLLVGKVLCMRVRLAAGSACSATEGCGMRLKKSRPNLRCCTMREPPT